MSAPNELLWALIGLLLTIGGTFLEAFVTNPPWDWSEHGIQTLSLGVTYQIGAVLLTGCLGGKNAGALSQIAYVCLGLFFPVFPVFTQGGGIGYLKEPTFGYLIGFIAGAWVCGFLAFRMPPRLESLAFSCLCGLLTIHIYGLAYLMISNFAFNGAGVGDLTLIQAIMKYSIDALPRQLVIVCAVTVLAFFLRQLMFY
ncbi:MAG: biotin transporter BioY [Symploca sp. SIO3C6]|uniref:Biotin transporter n=1 Tax=Symploca sp. SIO1C4 TaxID=2607765 RepID=A0A6B3NJ00_9CYAN|nr:biotin transporter BioY [Symploca sp. SIO3C6]NER31693.1 biotin transporter BioY [Symploca sp. SIO1C4]NET04616.1 biotin transporter BioY [Symploca sp. SIO2B6]NET51512.1 biotin transporter BioY [Merismopedia sp. SIO2A8]